MTHFRKWILIVGITVAMLLPLGTPASADPSDGGQPTSSQKGPWSPTSDPSDGGQPTP